MAKRKFKLDRASLFKEAKRRKEEKEKAHKKMWDRFNSEWTTERIAWSEDKG